MINTRAPSSNESPSGAQANAGTASINDCHFVFEPPVTTPISKWRAKLEMRLVLIGKFYCPREISLMLSAESPSGLTEAERTIIRPGPKFRTDHRPRRWQRMAEDNRVVSYTNNIFSRRSLFWPRPRRLPVAGQSVEWAWSPWPALRVGRVLHPTSRRWLFYAPSTTRQHLLQYPL